MAVPEDLVRCFYTVAFALPSPQQQQSSSASASSSKQQLSQKNLHQPTSPQHLVLNTSSNTINTTFTFFTASAAEEEENKPFYFGIDCRSDQERSLGQFPKAYAFDAAGLADGDEINKLLDMVETMAASAHLCLIGAGEGFVRWEYEQNHKKRANSRYIGGGGNSSNKRNSSGGGKMTDPPELQHLLEEHNSRLDAVAMFFLKRSFKHVR